jgi:signal transduction histidine kinase
MRFSEFIVANQRAILDEWVTHARTLVPWANAMSVEQLEDHGRQLILAIAEDMGVAQTEELRAFKSKYRAEQPEPPHTAAAEHGRTRQASGFDPMQMHGEFRALRASILRLWARSELADTGPVGAEETARFNEAVDQALAESVERYSAEVAKSRDLFLAVLGHDIRGPLGAIGVAGELLARGNLAESTQIQLSSRVLRACAVINHLTTDLLEYSRSRLGSGIPVEASACDLGALCADALDAMRATHPHREFVARLSGDLHSQCDKHRISQVLWNLLDNAVHHSDPVTPVTLEAAGQPDSVVIRVTSFGEPISPNSLHSIFEPMVRAVQGPYGPASQAGSSLGLGLFIVREVVRGHGGTVKVASSREQGTVFTVELPKPSS